MMRTLAAAIVGLTLGGLTLAFPAAAQETGPGRPQSQPGSGMPAGLLPGSYAPAPAEQPARGSEQPTIPGGDHTAALPANGETASAPSNGMVLGGSDASAALPEMQVPTRPGEGKGTLQ